MNQYIYHFNNFDILNNPNALSLLGNKGLRLIEMTKLNINVPQGFVILSSICNYYNKYGNFPKNFDQELKKSIKILEDQTNKFLGKSKNLLLLSVRSGASISMPGMMDSILNVGINDDMLYNTDNSNLFKDCYRRFFSMYGSTVLEIEKTEFQNLTREKILELSTKELVSKSQKILNKYQANIPKDPIVQLIESIKASIRSWNTPRCTKYRNLYNLTCKNGTAVIVQSMVFGNYNNKSATGVVFSRNPIEGTNELYGEFLINAQGEDIVSGKITPKSIDNGDRCMKNLMSERYKELKAIARKLESYYTDMQDIEFTIENDKLYILQTRRGKRSTKASVKILVDFVKEKKFSKKTALKELLTSKLHKLLHARVNYSQNTKILIKGLPASPGATSGMIALSNRFINKTKGPVIFVATQTNAENISEIDKSDGILTSAGGSTSHAAVVARGLGKVCVCGANFIIDKINKVVKFEDTMLEEGDVITIDGNTGNVILGAAELKKSSLSEDLFTIITWADEYKKLSVRANAETVRDIKKAFEFKAEGIGLCRTEHMFLETNAIDIIRKVIVVNEKEIRDKILVSLLKLQKNSFIEILRETKSNPINIRLLDPPLHEFLPSDQKTIQGLARDLNLTEMKLKNRIILLKETNPMLGNRGCRLAIFNPEIYSAQAESLFTAASVLYQKEKIVTSIEVMVPFVNDIKELLYVKELIDKAAKKIQEEYQYLLKYKIGTMIELPRAALIADKIAKIVDFCSFGTNDLTQTCYGLSRDDVGPLLNLYIEKNILNADPFVKLDLEGVGELIKIATKKARSVNPDIILGMCGEHASDYDAIKFCYEIGLNYISCSPYRIPAAKIAAAQVTLEKSD